MESVNQDELVQLTAEIVSAYVSNNKVDVGDLGQLIGDVHAALQQAPNGKAEPEPAPREPAVPIRRSVTPDYIVSLEDGRKFKSLKRHLKNTYGLTPDEYRKKWNLPRDYPIRVLSAALAYRLWRTEGKLPRYEDGANALHVQQVGIPGLDAPRPMSRGGSGRERVVFGASGERRAAAGKAGAAVRDGAKEPHQA